MREYVADAIILDKEPVGERDSRVHCFTEKFGKVLGRATSARKVTSKLAAHLEPGVISRMRFTEKKGVRITDALISGRVAVGAPDLARLARVLGESSPEPALWHLLRSGDFSWPAALSALGWDPRGSACSICSGRPNYFYLDHHEFLCALCAARLPGAAVIAL